MAKEKPGVMMYWDTFDVIGELEDSPAKELVIAIRNYAQYGILPEFEDKTLKVVWRVIQPKIDADDERYNRQKQQRIEAGKASAQKRKEQKESQTSVDEIERPLTSDNESKPNTYTNTYTNTETDTETKSVSNTDASQTENTDTHTEDIYESFMELFNSNTSSFISVRELKEHHKRNIDAILKDFTIDQVVDVFERAEKSDWLTGKKGAWRADFDWIINPVNFVKVANGEYDDYKKGNKAAKKLNDFYNMAEEWANGDQSDLDNLF